MQDSEYLNFKFLLEYFVSHLEWIVNNDTSYVGYKKYIAPQLQNKKFKITGQGYKGGKIQDQISDWDQFEGNQICINITFNQKIGYQSKFCYLNWIWTGINIIAEWKNKQIVGLYQELFIEKNKPEKSIWQSLQMSKSIQELGLFDSSNLVNSNLKSFYNNFRSVLAQDQIKQQAKKQMVQIEKQINLLEYKKQIILQGPPGTGKTRLAKNLFYNILDTELKKEIDELYFREILVMGFQFSFKNGMIAKISKIVSEKLVLDIKNQGEDVSFTYQEVYDCYKDNDFLEKDFVGYNRYAVRSIVSYIVKSLRHDKIEKQFKLIQFHPSYTYEDFVRGIVSKPNPEGDGIIYEAENKTLAAFAEAALVNYKEATQKIPVSPVADVFEAFIENVKDEMALDINHKYPITDAVYLFAADETRFKYRGDNWVAHQKGLNMKFSELKQIIEADVTERQAIKKMTGLEELTRQHATYFLKVAERFYEFRANFKAAENKSAAVTLRNYVLVIDEINRANLSSVLGELIYALEYRGEEVESMYKVDSSSLENKKNLILPPNLYIIGTMNTADRSVGHIDYAIKRRFAFVDVLPENLKETQGLESFDDKLFLKVAELFDTNLSNEFKKCDVQLGHSYFIDKSEEGGPMNIRFEYEIKPILLEYVKDGVLVGSVTVTEGGQVKEIPVEDYIHSLS